MDTWATGCILMIVRTWVLLRLNCSGSIFLLGCCSFVVLFNMLLWRERLLWMCGESSMDIEIFDSCFFCTSPIGSLRSSDCGMKVQLVNANCLMR